MTVVSDVNMILDETRRQPRAALGMSMHDVRQLNFLGEWHLLGSFREREELFEFTYAEKYHATKPKSMPERALAPVGPELISAVEEILL